MPENSDPKQQKALVDEIVQRAKSDPNFQQQLRQDPVQALQQAGLHPGIIGDLLRDEGADPADRRFSGKLKNSGDVDVMRSCWFTCATTNGCSLTISTA
jgi:hypothetical protein